MSTSTRPLTADELWRMPSPGRCELVRGELHRMAPAGHHHGRITMRFSTPLDQYVQAHGSGEVYAAETGFRIARDPDTVRAPDVSFVTRERVLAAGEFEGFWPGAPDLVVEVLSPSDVFSEVQEKVLEWLEAGTRLVIVLDPRRRVATTYRSQSQVDLHTGDATLDCGDVVPGFAISLDAVFR